MMGTVGSVDDDATTTGGTSLCNETAKEEAVQQRIQLLQSVHTSEDGWKNVIIGRDENNYCTKLEIFAIRQRSAFLCCAYQMALMHMNDKTLA
jgi:hypothetical protein